MNLCTITTKIHPEDPQPNIVVPFAGTMAFGSSGIFDAVKLNLATQGFLPRIVKVDRIYSYDFLFRSLWAEGEPFILVEHDIVPWPGALAELWNCPEPWCGFPYFIFGELRSQLGCTKFDPANLGECPLTGDPIEWQVIDKAIEKRLVMRGQNGHMHSPAVTHLNINHSRMASNVQLNPYFWKAVNA